MAKSTAGYIVMKAGEVMAQQKSRDGFYVLRMARPTQQYCTLFKTREEATTAIIADREWCRFHETLPPPRAYIVRVQGR